MDEILQEFAIALAEIEERIIRWSALMRIADNAATQDDISEEQSFMGERKRLIQEAQVSMTALRDHGYPDVPMRSLGSSECKDLRDDLELISAALEEDIICPTISATGVAGVVGVERPIN